MSRFILTQAYAPADTFFQNIGGGKQNAQNRPIAGTSVHGAIKNYNSSLILFKGWCTSENLGYFQQHNVTLSANFEGRIASHSVCGVPWSDVNHTNAVCLCTYSILHEDKTILLLSPSPRWTHSDANVEYLLEYKSAHGADASITPRSSKTNVPSQSVQTWGQASSKLGFWRSAQTHITSLNKIRISRRRL